MHGPAKPTHKTEPARRATGSRRSRRDSRWKTEPRNKAQSLFQRRWLLWTMSGPPASPRPPNTIMEFMECTERQRHEHCTFSWISGEKKINPPPMIRMNDHLAFSPNMRSMLL
ncbi:hypothetical protein BRADI_1g70805v3 [Brachypodium distachyon]|uniref:Uncharacterized protein n=1 Tax=Brachypodium distachyon TaxID=15368 RepID=A0A0Q3SDJ0_BRADI|nr:hypothetical protein BRADI_1g70805v3 [Brachypodium distachyon]PNT77944.1 hypothetical protein BRADI_1g70805v3 [Brachypodium distachyon]